MNPLLEKKFERVRAQLEQLREVLEANREDTQRQHEEKEDLLQEQWRQRKRSTTLSRIAEDYDALETENEAFRDDQEQIKERMGRLLKYTRSLQRGYKR